MPYCFISRRARERTSIALSAGVSSIRIGASFSRPSAVDSLSQSSAAEAPGAKLVLVEPADGADQAHRELRRAHFHREHGDRHAGVERDVLADVERERGLTHARSSGDDDQVAGLESGGHPVEVGEAGGNAGDIGRVVAVVERLDAFDDGREQLADHLEVLRAARALLGDMQHLRLGLVEHRLGAAPSGLNADSAMSVAVAASWRRIERSRTMFA